MSDISYVNLPDGVTYNITDLNALHHITVPDYDATSTYNLGAFVTYNGNIYICTTAIATPEAWNSSHWELVDADHSYLHSLNPKGAGSFSLNRKANTTIGNCSFAEGYNNTASGSYSHAEGHTASATGVCSHAEGNSSIASGVYSHAEGDNTTASGHYGSHAEGKYTTAGGNHSHAEGYYTTADGTYSHAEGYNATVSGNNGSHAEGYYTSASGGYGAHAEGYYTSAMGNYSHAEGYNNTASGSNSHAEGEGTRATHKSQHIFGAFNVLDPSTASSSSRGNYVEIVGNGTNSSTRSNARTLDWNGNEVLSGGLKINSTQDVATQVSLTQAEYDALVSAGTVDLVNTIYFITDANAIAGSAAEITYSNTGTGLSANTVQTAITEVNSLIPSWIKQTPGTTFGAILPFIFFYYYADQWTAYVQLPFVMKNVNYSVSLDDVIAENIGSIVSKCSVVDKQYCYFEIRTTKTMPSFPNLYSTNAGRCRFTITFA